MTSTTVASDAHNHWVSADRINVQICKIRDFARVIMMAATDFGVEVDAIGTVAQHIVKMCEQAQEAIDELQNQFHSADIADNGEVEEAEGER